MQFYYVKMHVGYPVSPKIKHEWLINTPLIPHMHLGRCESFCIGRSQCHWCDYMDNALGAKPHHLTRWPVTPYMCLHRSIEAPYIWIIRWYTSVWNSSEIVWALIQQLPTKIIPWYYINKKCTWRYVHILCFFGISITIQFRPVVYHFNCSQFYSMIISNLPGLLYPAWLCHFVNVLSKLRHVWEWLICPTSFILSLLYLLYIKIIFFSSPTISWWQLLFEYRRVQFIDAATIPGISQPVQYTCIAFVYHIML